MSLCFVFLEYLCIFRLWNLTKNMYYFRFIDGNKGTPWLRAINDNISVNLCEHLYILLNFTTGVKPVLKILFCFCFYKVTLEI